MSPNPFTFLLSSLSLSFFFLNFDIKLSRNIPSSLFIDAVRAMPPRKARAKVESSSRSRRRRRSNNSSSSSSESEEELNLASRGSLPSADGSHDISVERAAQQRKEAVPAGKPKPHHGAASTIILLECPTCGKAFRGDSSRSGVQSNYRRHLLTHSQVRPYVCRCCAAGYTTSTNLRRHMKSAHRLEGFSVVRQLPAESPPLNIREAVFTDPHAKDVVGTLFYCQYCTARFDRRADRDAHEAGPCAAAALPAAGAKANREQEEGGPAGEPALAQGPSGAVEAAAAGETGSSRTSSVSSSARVSAVGAPGALDCPHCCRSFLGVAILKLHVQTCARRLRRRWSARDRQYPEADDSNNKGSNDGGESNGEAGPRTKIARTEGSTEEEEARTRESGTARVFVCPDCEQELSTRTRLKRHRLYHCPFRESDADPLVDALARAERRTRFLSRIHPAIQHASCRHDDHDDKSDDDDDDDEYEDSEDDDDDSGAEEGRRCGFLSGEEREEIAWLASLSLDHKPRSRHAQRQRRVMLKRLRAVERRSNPTSPPLRPSQPTMSSIVRGMPPPPVFPAVSLTIAPPRGGEPRHIASRSGLPVVGFLCPFGDCGEYFRQRRDFRAHIGARHPERMEEWERAVEEGGVHKEGNASDSNTKANEGEGDGDTHTPINF